MSTLSSEEQAQIEELDTKQGVINDWNTEISGFDEDACKEEMEHGAEDALNGLENQDSTSTSSEDSEDMVPMKLLDDWNNGCTDAQILGVSYGDTSFLKYAPKLVRIGSWETEVEVSVPVTGKFDLSQAEFFYDCDQKWDSGACKNGDPMWHFRWRARLRRYNAPFGDNDNLQTVVGAAIGSEAYIQAVEAFDVDTLNHRNIQLYPDLIEAGDPDDILVH